MAGQGVFVLGYGRVVIRRSGAGRFGAFRGGAGQGRAGQGRARQSVFEFE